MTFRPSAGVKLNMRLGLDAEDTVTTLRAEDILAVVKELVNLKDGKGPVDDIDNLGNRRVRSVGELLENQYRVGLPRLERAVKERSSSVDVSTVMPNDLINAKPDLAAVHRVLRLSPALPVHGSRPTRCRRSPTSAAFRRPGPSSLGRERAGFEVRDDHPTPPADLPDRNAGRPEHRPDQLARELQPGQQVRLHRDAATAR